MSVDANFSLGSVNTALTPQERFEEFMQTRGKRITRQRQVIIDHVTARHEHFDAEQLLVDLKKTPAGAQASRPTIYRTLNEMVEAGILKKHGFDHVLLVTGESGRKVGIDYLARSLSALRPHFSNLSIEVQPLHQKEYEALIGEGLHAVLVYQETYEKDSYQRHHLKGRKRNFDWRLGTPDRLGQAGIKKIGLGCLFGLTEDWRTDAYFAAQHLGYLERTYWKTTYSMSFPRLRPCAGEKPPVVTLKDRDMVQLLCAFRIFSHELELSLSTRESPAFRENLLPLGVTTMSAGSKTNPGGYTDPEEALEQFEVSDQRSPAEVCHMLEQKGYDPVFKDWDSSYDNPKALSEAFIQEVQASHKKRELVQAS